MPPDSGPAPRLHHPPAHGHHARIAAQGHGLGQPSAPPGVLASGPCAGVHVHRGTRAIQRMVELAPSTGGLALWIRHRDVDDRTALEGESEGAGAAGLIAANDGAAIYYGSAFERLGLDEQVGLVAHQVLHVALRHPQRRADLERQIGDVDRELFGICADAIVNSALGHLSWLKLPPGSVHLDVLLSKTLDVSQAVEKSLLEWDLERLYRAIDDRRPPARQGNGKTKNGRSGGSGPGTEHRPQKGQASATRADTRGVAHHAREDGPKAAQARALGAAIIDDLLPAGDGDSPEQEAELAREWQERLQRAHAGDGQFSMLRVLLADLPRPRTPWEMVLRTRLARGLSMQPELSWSRPSRSYIANKGRAGPHKRMPWEPGRASNRRVPRLAVIVDTSGSVDEALVGRFAKEVESISRRLGASLTVVIGDREVTGVATFEPGKSNLRDIHFAGGGGTDFTPLLEEADSHGPDLCVVLTDLQGPARFRPRWPVIWAVPSDWEGAEEPFGTKLVLR